MCFEEKNTQFERTINKPLMQLFVQSEELENDLGKHLPIDREE